MSGAFVVVALGSPVTEEVVGSVLVIDMDSVVAGDSDDIIVVRGEQSLGGETLSAWLHVFTLGSQIVPSGQSKWNTEKFSPIPSQSTHR